VLVREEGRRGALPRTSRRAGDGEAGGLGKKIKQIPPPLPPPSLLLLAVHHMHGPGASHLHGWINHALLPSPPSFALHDRINYTSAQLNRLARFYRTLLQPVHSAYRSHRYFSLGTDQPPATSQPYSSQNKPAPAISQPNDLSLSHFCFAFAPVRSTYVLLNDPIKKTKA
jgi:hypothetical protein